MADKLPLVTRFKLSVLSLARRVYTRRDGTINRRLFDLIGIKPAAPSTKVINNVSVTTSDVKIDPSRTLWFRLFTPKTNSDTRFPLIVYFHGGGFREFGPDTKTFDNLCSHMAAKVPAVIASVNYRLAPEHKYPSQYEDGHDALKFIDAQNAAVLLDNADVSRCFVGGDSAGGNIAHHVTVKALKNSDHFNKVRIAGVLALQPFFGGEERTESELRLTHVPIINVERTDKLWRDFLPEGADRNHPVANVSGGGPNSEAAKELKNLEFPTTLVIVGGNDPLQDWGKKYAEWLKNCGKEVEITMFPNAFHGFYSFPEVPEFDLLFQRVTEFVQKHMHPK